MTVYACYCGFYLCPIKVWLTDWLTEIDSCCSRHIPSNWRQCNSFIALSAMFFYFMIPENWALSENKLMMRWTTDLNSLALFENSLSLKCLCTILTNHRVNSHSMSFNTCVQPWENAHNYLSFLPLLHHKIQSMKMLLWAAPVLPLKCLTSLQRVHL